MTQSDTRTVQKYIAMVVLENNRTLDEVKHTVLGYNGTPGLVSLVAVLTVQVSGLYNKTIKHDSFGKLMIWFIDRVLPTLTVALLAWGALFFLQVYGHVDVLGAAANK